MGLHLSRMLNPPHEIVGSIWKFASDVIALANAIEAGTDQTSGAGNTGNFVAGIAAIFANFGPAQASISAAGERGGSLDFSAARAIPRDQHRQKSGNEHEKYRFHSTPPCDKRPSSARRVYCHLACDSSIHLTSRTSATISNSVPAGIHMMSPPIC